MLEIIKIIFKLTLALLPICWVLLWWLYKKKDKFEKTFLILTFFFFLTGIMDCIYVAVSL